MEFIIATNNMGKLREMRSILKNYGIIAVSMQEAGLNIEVEETGETFYDNALLKASAINKLTGKSVIADDSGLVVDSLGGAPGVHSRYFGGDDLDDRDRCLYLLEKMKNMEQRSAKFVCTIVCISHDGEITSAVGECRGEITHQLLGEGGFGFDPIFLVNSKNKTMAQLSVEEKNAVSHRSDALRVLAKSFAHLKF